MLSYAALPVFYQSVNKYMGLELATLYGPQIPMFCTTQNPHTVPTIQSPIPSLDVPH